MADCRTVRVDDVILTVHSANKPSDAEWDEHLDVVRRAATHDTPLVRMLVVTNGGAPGMKQRLQHERLYKELGATRIPIAVLSASSVVRRVVTMFALFGLNIRAFDPADASSALSWLALDQDRARHVADALLAIGETLDFGEVGQTTHGALRRMVLAASPDARLEAERQRIARDLHDGVGSSLAGLLWRMRAVSAQRTDSVGQELGVLGGAARKRPRRATRSGLEHARIRVALE